MIDVKLQRCAEHDCTVEVKKDKLPFTAGPNHVTGKLKCAGCVAKFKLHTYESRETMMEC